MTNKKLQPPFMVQCYPALFTNAIWCVTDTNGVKIWCYDNYYNTEENARMICDALNEYFTNKEKENGKRKEV